MPNQQFLSIALIAVSSNLDNLGVGISYAFRKIRVPIASNILIGAVTASGTFISIYFGNLIHQCIDATIASIVGGGIVVLAGIWILIQDYLLHRAARRHRNDFVNDSSRSINGIDAMLEVIDDPVKADRDHSGTIDPKESLTLAFGLSINNIPNGVAAGMLGLNPYWMSLVVFLTSIGMLWAGTHFGKIGAHRLGRSAIPLAGFLLVFIGIWEMVF
jgi:putative sporulation protein YtaF